MAGLINRNLPQRPCGVFVKVFIVARRARRCVKPEGLAGPPAQNLNPSESSDP